MHLNIKLVIFSVISGKLKIFLSNGKLPAGELPGDKSLDKSAEFLFAKSTNLSPDNIYFEQLYTFSSQKQEEIAVVYYFLVPEHKIYSNINKWYEIKRISTNHIDSEIITYAIQRLRWKIEYTNVVYSLLPTEFTFSQLQFTYEAILRKKLDKRNFRKKIMALGILKDTGHIKKRGRARPALRRGRPAEMFAFKKKKLTFVKIL